MAVAVTITTLAAGCSSTEQPQDELMVSANPVAATAARSPAPTATPAGRVLPQGAVSALAIDKRTLAVAVTEPPGLRLYDLYDLDALDRPPRQVDLPAAAETLALSGDKWLAATGKGVISVAPDATTATSTVDGPAAAAVAYRDGTLVAVRERKSVAVLDHGGVQRVISGGLMSADQVYAVGEHAAVLDRVRNAVFELDIAKGTVGEGLRAGSGATNGVVDRFGRVLVTDTRGEALLAFSLDPLLMRQRFPVPGAPYAIAYDARRDLAWVTLTATNEVVGLHVAAEQPQQRYRFPTVGQPDSVAVDSTSGRVIVASANGGGVQVIEP